MANNTDIGEILGFTQAWYTLGIVDESVLDRAKAHWDTGEDDNTEHYRWRAFKEFLTTRRPLSPELATALYELGAADADSGMGGSIMVNIVYLPECPRNVLDAASASGQRHLVRAVEQRPRQST